MQTGTVLQSSEVGKLVHWEFFEDFEKAVKTKDYTLAKSYVEKDCEEGRYLARASCNFLQTVGHEVKAADVDRARLNKGYYASIQTTADAHVGSRSCWL